jgi:hypothetical protein
MTAPVASGWSIRRVGLTPTGKRRLFHGAHPKVTFGQATCPNRGEKCFAPLVDEIRTLSRAPHGRILKPNRNSCIVRRHATGAIGNSAPRFRIAYSTNEFSGPEMIAGSTGWEIEMDDRTVRVALERHWDASDASDFKVEHEIYREDAVLDYPQSGERIRGRHNIQQSRFLQPNKKRFTVRRIVGSGDLWVTEFILSYDGIPSYAVSIMEFREGLVANETQYFADRFDPAPSRAHLVERVGEITSF